MSHSNRSQKTPMDRNAAWQYLAAPKSPQNVLRSAALLSAPAESRGSKASMPPTEEHLHSEARLLRGEVLSQCPARRSQLSQPRAWEDPLHQRRRPILNTAKILTALLLTTVSKPVFINPPSLQAKDYRYIYVTWPCFGASFK